MEEFYRDGYYTDEMAANLERIAMMVRAIDTRVYENMEPDDVVVGIIVGLALHTVDRAGSAKASKTAATMIKKAYNLAVASILSSEDQDTVGDKTIREMLKICNYA